MSDVPDTVTAHVEWLRRQGYTPREAAATIRARVSPDAGWDEVTGLFAAAFWRLRGIEEPEE